MFGMLVFLLFEDVIWSSDGGVLVELREKLFRELWFLFEVIILGDVWVEFVLL